MRNNYLNFKKLEIYLEILSESYLKFHFLCSTFHFTLKIMTLNIETNIYYSKYFLTSVYIFRIVSKFQYQCHYSTNEIFYTYMICV